MKTDRCNSGAQMSRTNEPSKGGEGIVLKISDPETGCKEVAERVRAPGVTKKGGTGSKLGKKKKSSQ